MAHVQRGITAVNSVGLRQTSIDQARQAGSSFITPLVSLFYIFKTVMVLLVNHLRPAETVPEGESK